METQLEEKEINRINPTPVLQQTAFWARVKQKQGLSTLAFDIEIGLSGKEYFPGFSSNRVMDDVLIVKQPVNRNAYIAYIPYGPVLEPDDELKGPYLEELSESLIPRLPKGCLTIRYDLSWESPWVSDEGHTRNSDWMGPPDPQFQEIRLNMPTKNRNLFRAVSGVLPSDTLFLNLKKSKNELLREMKPKTRYNIRLSKRKGVSVQKAGLDSLPEWMALQRETASRNKIITDDYHYFRSVLQTQARDSRSPAEVHFLLAKKHDSPLAAMFEIISGGRATYLFGASSSRKRNLMPSYALQWEAINLAKEKGCQEYDMFGISPFKNPSNPLYGLYRFKTGFGGRIFHRMGCWDYPIDYESYKAYRMAELNSSGYHLQ